MKLLFKDGQLLDNFNLILSNKKLDKLKIIDNVYELSFTENYNSQQEGSCVVYKKLDNKVCKVWNKLDDFGIVYLKETNTYYQIKVSPEESDILKKTLTLSSLCEAELGSIKLFDVEINTDDDIAREDYTIPSVLYRENNHKASILHRILEKAPHYSIGHIDTSLMSIQRSFSFDDKSIYDALMDISEEIKCLFVFDSTTRTISCYDLLSVCLDCGNREEMDDKCPKCNSKNIKQPYGEDSGIYIDTSNLAQQITLDKDMDNVFNTLKLKAGDELMTATIRTLNPNGTDYIYYFNQETLDEMPKTLSDKLISYNELVDDYEKNYVLDINDDDLISNYNALVSKYNGQTYAQYEYNDEDEKVLTNNSFVSIDKDKKGYNNLIQLYFDIVDFNLYLESSLMPTTIREAKTAKEDIINLTENNLNPLALSEVKSATNKTTVENALKALSKIYTYNTYKITVNTQSWDYVGDDGKTGFHYGNWEGTITLQSYSDNEDIATTGILQVKVTDDYETYLSQKIRKQIISSNESLGGIYDLVGIDISEDSNNFAKAIKYYSLERLTSFYDAYRAALDVLIEVDQASEQADFYNALYVPYYERWTLLDKELEARKNEIDVISRINDVINALKIEVQKALDFKIYLGDEWLNFCSYRRESTFENSNYISTGLSNSELIDNANKYMELAKKEAIEAGTPQITITISMSNIFAREEFKNKLDKFVVGNWIRAKCDDYVYKIRLTKIQIDTGSLDNCGVEFSTLRKKQTGLDDTESILQNAKTISNSYSYVATQVDKSKKITDIVENWFEKGLDGTLKIFNDANNQQVTYDKNGMLVRSYDDIDEVYLPQQLRVINSGIAISDDNWKTVKTALGKYYYTDPENGQKRVAYGLNGETLVGKLLLGQTLKLYSETGYNSMIFDDNGIDIVTRPVNGGYSDSIFSISKQDSKGNRKKLFYLDNDGELIINTNQINLIADTANKVQDAIDLAGEGVSKTELEYYLSTSTTQLLGGSWSTESPTWKQGYYVWVRTKMYYKNGDAPTYSNASCIAGAKGEQGLPGKDGSNGKTVYFHIKYSNKAEPTLSSDMTETPSTYIGTCVDYNEVDPTDPTSYTWSKFMGDPGTDGIPGTNGKDGKTYYWHIAYSNSDDGNKDFSLNESSNRDYIGQYVDELREDSTDPAKYTWSKIKGEQGVKGEKGNDGKQYYTWLKYADSPTSGMSDLPTGKAYIGLAYNKETSDESNNYSDYTWSLIKGEKGDQGVKGDTGVDGKQYYTWIKYATDTEGSNMSDDPDGCSYIGLAYNKLSQQESNNPKDYIWSKIKGENGKDGVGIKKITPQYAKSSSNEIAPTSGWSTSQPSIEEGQYIWTRSFIEWTDGSSTSTTPVLSKVAQGLADAIASLTVQQGQIESKVSKTDYTGQTIASLINQDANTIKISASKIDLEGKVTFKALDSDTQKKFSDITSSSNDALSKADNALNNANDALNRVDDLEKKADNGDFNGQDGRGVSSTKIEYQTSKNGTNAPDGTWLTSIPTVNQGEYLWTKITITYTTGDPSVIYSVARMGVDGIKGDKGNDGNSITIISTSIKYQSGTSGITKPTGVWSSTIPSVNEGDYLWCQTIVTYSDNTTTESYICSRQGENGVDGTNGVNGKDGVSPTVSNTSIQYQQSTSGTNVPSDDEWNDNPPFAIAGQYIWTRTTITYSDNKQVVSYNVSKNGVDGNNGKSIGSVVNYYLATNVSSGITIESKGWTSTVQSVSATAKYLWNYEVIKYTDDTVASLSNPCVIGTYGEKGAKGDSGDKGDQGNDGKGISSIAEYYALSTSKTSVPTLWYEEVQTMTSTNKYLWNYERINYTDGTYKDTDKRIIGAFGNTGRGVSNITSYYLASSSKSNIYTTSSGWQDTPQTLTPTLKYHWSYQTITYTNGDIEKTTPCIIGVYGDTGLQGNEGKGIKSVKSQYYLSSSNTKQLDGEWKDSLSKWEHGKYYWIRDLITWSDDTQSTTTPVLNVAYNDSLELAYATSTVASDLDKKIASWCYENDETIIDGAKIYTGNITALGNITAGSFNLGNGKFIVTNQGSLTALSGKISSFTINNDSLVSSYSYKIQDDSVSSGSGTQPAVIGRNVNSTIKIDKYGINQSNYYEKTSTNAAYTSYLDLGGACITSWNSLNGSIMSQLTSDRLMFFKGSFDPTSKSVTLTNNYIYNGIRCLETGNMMFYAGGTINNKVTIAPYATIGKIELDTTGIINVYSCSGNVLPSIRFYNGKTQSGVSSEATSVTSRIVSNANGTLTAYSSISNSSDKRLKQNIENMPVEYNNILMNLKPKTYRYKNNTKDKFIGFIAQDVLDQIKEYDSDSMSIVTKSEDGYYSLDYNQIIPLLVQGYQKQQEEIENLKRELKKLNGK